MRHIKLARILTLAMIPLMLAACGGKDSSPLLFPLGGPPPRPAGQGGPDQSPPQPPADENGNVADPAPAQSSVETVGAQEPNPAVTPPVPPVEPATEPAPEPAPEPSSEPAPPAKPAVQAPRFVSHPAPGAHVRADIHSFRVVVNQTICPTHVMEIVPAGQRRKMFYQVKQSNGNFEDVGEYEYNCRDNFAYWASSLRLRDPYLKKITWIRPGRTYRVMVRNSPGLMITGYGSSPLVREVTLDGVSYLSYEFTTMTYAEHGHQVADGTRVCLDKLSFHELGSTGFACAYEPRSGVTQEFEDRSPLHIPACASFSGMKFGVARYWSDLKFVDFDCRNLKNDPDVFDGATEGFMVGGYCDYWLHKPSMIGYCIVNPGENNEYVKHYYYGKAADHKARCRGIWRNGNVRNPAVELMKPVGRVCKKYQPDTKPSGGNGSDNDPKPGDNPGSNDKPKKNVVDHGPEQKCEARTITLDTTKGRWFETPKGEIPHHKRANKKIRVRGIHTYWADQKLVLRVRDNCNEGWYNLRLQGKNIQGPLPTDYKRFNVLVKRDGQALGGVNLRAADDRYRTGALLVRLPAGDSDFELVWTNDAVKEGEYDTNLQIKNVTLKYKRYVRVNKRLTRRAHDYCDVAGRWFWDDRSARTYWKDQTISFCFPDLKAGKYRIEIAAKNYGVLPPDYKHFEVAVAADGVAAQANIRAHAKKYRRGSAVLDLTGGDTRVDLTWLNEVYKEGEYDSNIQLRNIKLVRVGDSERSPLAAILMRPGRFKAAWLAAIFAGALLAAFASGVLKRRFE